MWKQIDQLQLDRYTKKLDSVTFSKLFIFAQMKQLTSLTDIGLMLNTNEDLQHELDLESISVSQLSRKLGDIDPAFFDSIFDQLAQDILRTFGFQQGSQVLKRLNLIDASTISLCLTQYRWAEFRNTKAGVKLHTRVVVDGDAVCPDKAIFHQPSRQTNPKWML